MPYTRPFAGRFIAPLAAVALLSAPLATAQDPRGQTLRVDVNLVLLEATVKDKSGHVMGGLKKEDFVLDEDGTPQKIEHFSRDEIPLAVALVVDLSSSIQPFIRPLRYATLTALKSLKPEDEVALFTFSSDVERRVALTHDKRDVSDQIESLETGGSTDINDAVYEAARYLARARPSARRVIVLVSDNVPSGRHMYSPEDVVNAALEADAAVYGLKVPGQNPWEARVAAKARGMLNVERTAQETGGEVFDIEKEGSLYVAFQALIERLKTRYTVGFYSTFGVSRPGFHKLSLRLQPSFGRSGRDYTILSKNGYYPAGSRASTR
jgi:Ca-activated chloride channel family protein